jgi:hypothetical protein
VAQRRPHYRGDVIRSAFYVDGFNVYHALDRLQRPHLKWLDWRALAATLIAPKSEQIVKIAICTAIKTDDPDKMIRHRAYVRALEAVGVDCMKGHFADEKRSCKRCQATWDAPVEKQGDVNLALAILDDAYQDVFDRCYIVTADGDQAATVRTLRARFPNKPVVSLILPGQRHNKAILAQGASSRTVSADQLERSLLPKLIPGPAAILRPQEYDPPGA